MRKSAPTRRQTPRELELLDRLNYLSDEQHKTNAENIKLLKAQIELTKALLAAEQEIGHLRAELAVLKKQLVSHARNKPTNAGFPGSTFFSPEPRDKKSPTQPPISDGQYARLCSKK